MSRSLLLVAALAALGVSSAVAQYPDVDLQLGGAPEAVESMHDCNDPANPVLTCGFETVVAANVNDFTDWVENDAAAPFIPMQQVPAGATAGFGFFLAAPTEGSFEAFLGFDAGGPDTVELAQDVTLDPNSAVTLEFDYRGAWDLLTFGATMDRTFEVQVQPAGGGAPLQTDLIFTAPAGDVTLDTGPQSATVDLSAHSGQTVRLALVANIPENFTGPGQLTIDNVLITQVPSVSTIEIPTLSQAGAVLVVLLLGAAAVVTLRRRRA